MKKTLLNLGIAACIGLMSMGVMAQVPTIVPISAPVEIGNVSPMPEVNLDVNITKAEFILAIVKTTGEDITPPMDTHYALTGMELAEKMGLISLEEHPMETWSDNLTKEEKTAILEKVSTTDELNFSEVNKALTNVLVEKVVVGESAIDLQNYTLSAYNGQLMLPLRPVAEALGFKVEWDKDTYSATISNGVVKSTLEMGFDNYCYTSVEAIGMSAPTTLGASPKLIQGTMYVPAAFFDFFSYGEMNNGILSLFAK